MDEDLQKAYKIIKKEFGKRRYKTVNSCNYVIGDMQNEILIHLSKYVY